MRRWVAAKLHGLRVTGKSVHYNGSVTVDADLLRAVGMAEFEAVDIVNLSNGERWTTYLLAGGPGVFTLNGGGARLGEIGDPCVLMTWRVGDSFTPAEVVFLDEANRVVDRMRYQHR